uniref:C-CAP/cofactor C-like domain-containing protein n=1 Tax=Hanusia phi TaxID=3032 RepID=A0A7S0E084_9CRYP|mmetsp:Transcript_14074/g.32450  ORF Transcript_14074/g.32450 Transcript_14074/m.32450 type:complete len:401 (+) Transcript_14074:42-1244(+)
MSFDIFKSLNLEGLNLNFWGEASSESVRMPDSTELPQSPLDKEFVESTFTRVGSGGFSRLGSDASERRNRSSPECEFKRTRSRESVASQHMAYQNAVQELQELKKENNRLQLLRKKYVYRKEKLLSTEENAHMTFGKEAPRTIIEAERTKIHGYVDEHVTVPARKSGPTKVLEISRNRTTNFRCVSPIGTLLLRDCDSVFVMADSCSMLYIENCSHSRIVLGAFLPPTTIISSEDCLILCLISSEHQVSISSTCSKGIVIRYLEEEVKDAVAVLEKQAQAKSMPVPCLLTARVRGTIIECSLKPEEDAEQAHEDNVQYICRKDLLLVDAGRSYTKGAGETFFRANEEAEGGEVEEEQQQPEAQPPPPKLIQRSETKKVLPNAAFRRRKGSVIEEAQLPAG